MAVTAHFYFGHLQVNTSHSFDVFRKTFKVGVWSGGRQNEEGKKGWEEQAQMSRGTYVSQTRQKLVLLCQEHSFFKRVGKRG